MNYPCSSSTSHSHWASTQSHH